MFKNSGRFSNLKFWRTKNPPGAKPVALDTITTRFLFLFLFLISIPLISVIIFTVSLLVSHMDDANAFQLSLGQKLVDSEIEDVTEKIALVEASELVTSGKDRGIENPQRLCTQLNLADCLVISTYLNKKQLYHPSLKSLRDLERHSPDAASLSREANTEEPFYAQIKQQIYRLRPGGPDQGHAHPLLLGLPLDAGFFRKIYREQPNLQAQIWLVADNAGSGSLLLKAANPQDKTEIPAALLLKTLQTTRTLPSSPVNLELTGPGVNRAPYMVMQEPLYSRANRQVGRLLYILPLSRNQFILSNYYVGIYIIAVASLVFSVLLAMLAGRTITQPLLKLIRQVNMLSRENASRVEEEVNITGVYEIQQLGEAFNRMMKRLKQEHKMRDEFVATLTHDLKVPLLAERQTLSYMAQATYGPISEEQTEVLASLQSSNRSCLSLVYGLLEVYRYDAGEVALTFDTFDLSALIQEVVTEFQALAQEKQIRVDVENGIPGDDEDRRSVYADRLEIKRVLGNLISNAIVNTPQHGYIRCKITNAEYYGGDTIYKVSSFQHTSLKHPVKLSGRLLVTVQDSGLGFSSEDLGLLFKQFAANKSRNPMSIGLGLYNCHQVLKAHKGVVWVESTEGEGSLVNFILPQNKQAAQDRRIFRDRRRYPEN